MEEALILEDLPSKWLRTHFGDPSAKIVVGDLEGGLKVFLIASMVLVFGGALFFDPRQMREDNSYTFVAHVNEGRRPYHKT